MYIDIYSMFSRFHQSLDPTFPLPRPSTKNGRGLGSSVVHRQQLSSAVGRLLR